MPRPKYLLIIAERLSPPEPVDSFEEASRRFQELRDEADEGASTWPDGLINDYGMNVARISYNGKVWPMGKWTSQMKPLFNPYGESADG